MAEQHCPGCRGYAGPHNWDEECPGLPAAEAPPARAPLDMAGNATWMMKGATRVPLPGLCHCRIGKPHDVTELSGYDQEHDRADSTGPSRPGARPGA